MTVPLIASSAECLNAFQARQDPTRATRYTLAVDETIDQNIGGMARYNLWRLSSGVLFDRNPRIYLKEWHDTPVAGCHLDLASSGAFEIKGLIKAPYASRSAPRDVVAYAIVETFDRHGDDTVVEACIRIMPEGWRDQFGRPHEENVPSRLLFEEFAFAIHGDPNDLQFVGDFRDAHLRDSLEPDGRTYRNRTLRSTARTLELARDYLGRRSNRAGVPF